MDIKIDQTSSGDQYLEYNTIGGIFDLYFMAGPSPMEVSKQYAEVVGLPAEPPFWVFGFHQCKYGYQDIQEVAEVVANYSTANIPLEVMWSNIDYMRARRVFTTDPDRYNVKLMKQFVDNVHARNQKYIMMLDPGIAEDKTYTGVHERSRQGHLPQEQGRVGL